MRSLEKNALLLRYRSSENRKKYSKTEELKCLFVKKNKKGLLQQLNEKNITDNKKFWKKATTFHSNKVLSTDRTNLIENNKTINDANETANIMYIFFSNIVINLNNFEYHDCGDISENISDSILKAIVKYRNHPNIKSIKRVSNSNKKLFLLILWTKRKFLRKLIVWMTQKHVKNQIYPQKLSLHLSFNASVNEVTFPSVFKLADVIPVFKKGSRTLKIITDQSLF